MAQKGGAPGAETEAPQGAATEAESGAESKRGKYAPDGIVRALNDGAIREEGEEIVNLRAVAARLGDELRGGKPYSVQRLRAIVASGWLALWRKNVGDEGDEYYSWFVCDGKGGRPDTIAEYVEAVRGGQIFTRSGGGSVTITKAPDGAAKAPDGFTLPQGITLAEAVEALAVANGLRFTNRSAASDGATEETETEAGAPTEQAEAEAPTK